MFCVGCVREMANCGVRQLLDGAGGGGTLN